MKKILDFVKNESGAVTVDWVVLTAGVVALAVAVVALLAGDTGIGSQLQAAINEAI